MILLFYCFSYDIYCHHIFLAYAYVKKLIR